MAQVYFSAYPSQPAIFRQNDNPTIRCAGLRDRHLYGRCLRWKLPMAIDEFLSLIAMTTVLSSLAVTWGG